MAKLHLSIVKLFIYNFGVKNDLVFFRRTVIVCVYIFVHAPARHVQVPIPLQHFLPLEIPHSVPHSNYAACSHPF